MSEESRPEWKKSKGEIGRVFNQELADEICRRMAQCESLIDICKEPHMPKIRAISNWRKENKEFDVAFLRAYRSGVRKAEGLEGDEKLSFPLCRTPHDVGRPTLMTEEVVLEILDKMEDGELLPHICKESHMPRVSTVYKWAREHQEFGLLIARAREIAAQSIASYCLDIADDSRNDFIEKKSKNGETFLAVDHENIQRSKLRIDTRKWIVASLDPRMREGPQVKLNITSPEIGTVSIGEDQQSTANDPKAALEEYQRLIKGE